MKTCALFLIFVYILSYAYTQKAFDHVSTLLGNFKQSNLNEQKQADTREANERKWCTNNINNAEATFNLRVKDVNTARAEIKSLSEKVNDWKIDLQERRKRVQANINLLNKFKKERCDNNLLFVKNLRDHIEGIDILELLKQDIKAYFAKKIPAVNRLLDSKTGKLSLLQIESMSSLSEEVLEAKLISKIMKIQDYSHLFDDANKLVLAQLIDFGDDVKKHVKNVDEFTKTRERTNKEVGSGHVDNTKGELKKLDTPGYQGSAQFNIETRDKILKLLCNLVKHLKASKNNLIKDEIRAAEDFAVFQRKLLAEDKHILKVIRELEIKIKEAEAKLITLRANLKTKEKLVVEAQNTLSALKGLCKSKYDYFERETNRRIKENRIIDQAVSIFSALLKRSQKYRANSRSQSNYAGEEYKKADNVQERVTGAKSSTQRDLQTRQQNRNVLAF